MREAMIICPIVGNDGTPLTLAIQAVQDGLINAFGGCTSTLATGAWRNEGYTQTEAVRCFVCAYAPDFVNDVALLNVANQYGHDAKQLSVYVRYANGDVELVETASLWQSKRKAA